MRNNRPRSKIAIYLVIFACAVAALILAAGGYTGIRVSYEVKEELVVPEEPILDVLRGASLDAIKGAVARSGKSVDQITELGGSLLFYAVAQGRIDVAAWAISLGASPNGVYPTERPLAEAIYKHNSAMVKLLLQSGADPDADMWYNITPRKIAEKQGDADITELLETWGEAPVTGGE